MCYSCGCTSFCRCLTFKFNFCSIRFYTIKLNIKIRFYWRNFCIFRFPYSGRQRLPNDFMVLCYFFAVYLTISYFWIYRYWNIDFCRSITIRTNRHSFMCFFCYRCRWLRIVFPRDCSICYPCRHLYKIACSAYIFDCSIFNRIDRFRLHSN